MKYKTTLLVDNPTEVDEFGSHMRIAHSLSDIIINEKEAKTIGLVGTWGSGKSTIISLLQKHIFSQDGISSKVNFVVFDVWAHEGDTLRRSFLERMTLSISGWTKNEKYWLEEKLKGLKKQKQTKTITSSPTLTFWGRVVLLSLVAIPFGSELFKYWVENGSWWHFGGAILFSLQPIWVLLCAKWFGKEKSSELLLLLINKKIESKSEEVIDELEPTSIEFEKYYNDLMTDCLSNNDKRLCIVIENLDRIQQDEAIKLISTLKPFLQSNDGDLEWKKRIFYVIPFDDRSVAKLWNNDSKTTQVFLEKLFQVRFYVPLQLLTDWQSFFAKKMKEAFEGIDNDTVYRLQRIYEISIDGTERRQPTPRQIIIYINQLIGIYSQWGGEIDIEHQSVFVVMRYYKNVDNLEDIDDELNKMSNISEFCQEAKIKDDLSGLYFNIDPNKARQYWLNTTVSNALTGADKKYFSETYDGLDINVLIETTLNRSINAWLKNEPRIVLNCIAALEGTVYINPYKRLLRSIEKIPQWQFLNPDYGELLSRIMLHWDDEKAKNKIVQSLGATGKLDDSQQKNNSKTYYEGLVIILQNCKRNQKLTYFDNFYLNTDFETYCSLASLSYADEDNKDIANYIRPQRNKYAETVKKLLVTFDDNSFNQRYSAALTMFCKLPTVQWHESIASKILEKLGNNVSLNNEEQGFYLSIILVLHKQHYLSADKVQATIKDKLLSGWIYHWLHYANQNKSKTNMALCVTLICSDISIAYKNQGGQCQNGYNYFVTNSQLPNLLRQNSEYTDEIIKLIVEHDMIEKVFENGQNAELIFKQVINPIVIAIMKSDEYKLLISPEILFYRFDYLYELSSADAEELAKESVNNGLVDEVLKYNDFMLSDLRLYNYILATENGRANDNYRKWLAEGLNIIKQEEWKASFEKDSLLKIMIKSIAKEAHGKQGEPLYSVLIDIIENVSIGKIEKEVIEDGLEDYLNILDSDHLMTFKKECRAILFKIENVTILSFFFESFEFLTSDKELIEQKADDFVLHIFDKTLTSGLNPEIIYKMVDNCPGVWKKAESSSKKVFMQKLEATIKENGSDEALNNLKAKIIDTALN